MLHYLTPLFFFYKCRSRFFMEVVKQKGRRQFMEMVPCIENNCILEVWILLQESRQCYFPFPFVFVWIGKAFRVAAVDEVPLLNCSVVSNVSVVVKLIDCVHCLLTTF